MRGAKPSYLAGGNPLPYGDRKAQLPFIRWMAGPAFRLLRCHRGRGIRAEVLVPTQPQISLRKKLRRPPRVQKLVQQLAGLLPRMTKKACPWSTDLTRVSLLKW